jgi:hypothetical protein
MLIYRFKIVSVEHEEYTMEIEIQPGQTFRDFHECIIETSELLPPDRAFFFPTDKKNKRSTEISLKSYKKQEKKFDPDLDEMVTVTSTPRLMKDSKIKNYIDDPHQRMIYEYFGKAPYSFVIELFKIVQSDGITLYPRCVKKTGELPKKTVPVPIPEPPKPEPEKAAVPKVTLPPLEALSKLDEVVEDEEELAKIEEGLSEFLDEVAPLEEEIVEKVNGREDEEEMVSIYDQDEEQEEGEVKHLEDYEDIENIDIKYSRYDTDPDDH